MLDKSLPYHNINMRADADAIARITMPQLPPDYTFRLFQLGDETHWARIETSVGEFETEADALSYFQERYLPKLPDLQERCVFIVSPEGLPIATAIAWFSLPDRDYQAMLHWVAVCPDHQGLGLGKALTQRVLYLFKQFAPNQAVWLHTQTWSHVAVKCYHSFGFNVVTTDSYVRDTASMTTYTNDFPANMEVLKQVMPTEYVDGLIATAIALP